MRLYAALLSDMLMMIALSKTYVQTPPSNRPVKTTFLLLFYFDKLGDKNGCLENPVGKLIIRKTVL